MKHLFCFFPLFLASVSAVFCEGFSVCAVQLEISPELYTSEENFTTHIQAIIKEAVEQDAPDIIIFPEYTGVFAAFFTIDPVMYLEGNDTQSFRDHPELFLDLIDPDAASVHSFFIQRDPRQVLDRIFGKLAREHDVYILAGSYFASHCSGERDVLRNRAVVYSPDGSRAYQQDKVFLTPYETDILEIDNGHIENARPFFIQNVKVGLSICMDTFHDEWEDIFSDIDVWIDIKANGEIFTPRQEQIFLRALPARIASSGVPLGITVCLTGQFYGFLWEGRSFLIVPQKGGTVRTLMKAASARSEELLYYHFSGMR